MKLFIASDVHGSATNLEKFFLIIDAEMAKNPDCKAVLLGDIYNHGPRNPFPDGYAPMRVARMLNDAMSFVTVIKGNCDSEVDEMISDFPIIGDFDMPWEGRTVFFTHGHKRNSENPPSGVKAGDVVFYGHYHVPKIQKVKGATYVCVGSVGLPFENNPPTYAELNLDGFMIKSFDGKELISEKFEK